MGRTWWAAARFTRTGRRAPVITPSKNLWHRMGACQVGGTVIDFVMRAERCSSCLACEMLLKDAPL